MHLYKIKRIHLMSNRQTLKMKLLVTLSVVALAIVGTTFAEKVKMYSDKFDYVNVNDILTNDRLREQYYKCFVDSGPCITPDAKFIKGIMADAIVNKCNRCTEKQKEGFDAVASWFTEHEPEKWEALIKKGLEDYKKKASGN